MTNPARLSTPLAALLFCLTSSNIGAANIVNQTYSGTYPASISGTLANQDTALEEAFTLTTSGNLTIFTSSYATGGFQPNLTLYDASGNYLSSGVVPGSSPVAVVDPATGSAFDGYLAMSNLQAGSYTIALTDFLLNQSITATNLSDGFNANYGSGTTFVDEQGNTRTGDYSLNISLAAASASPEPATVWLMGSPLLACVLLWARKRARLSN